MAMFTVYFDASGHPDSTPSLTVAGLAATAEHWVRIERLWKKVLSEYGVSELHMKNFAHSTGEFASWKGDSGRRQMFLSALIDILRRWVRHSFACSIDLEEYRRVDSIHHLRSLHSPLAIAGCKCIGHVLRWTKDQKINPEEVLFIFEDGDQDRGNLRQACLHDFGFEPLFQQKKQTIAFQAADLLAYEHNKLTRRFFADPELLVSLDEIRKPLKALHSLPHGFQGEDWSLLEAPNIENGCIQALRYLRPAGSPTPVQ